MESETSTHNLHLLTTRPRVDRCMHYVSVKILKLTWAAKSW